MGIIYIITDNSRLHQSIFKIGKTQNENLRSLETRYRNTIKNPLLLAFIDVGANYEIIERILLNLFIKQRINHGGKIESEWVQMPYITLVLAIKFVVQTTYSGIKISDTTVSGATVSGATVSGGILNEYYYVDKKLYENKTIAELQILPKFFENRLVNHTQNINNFEPDIFCVEILFISYDKWPIFIKQYYSSTFSMYPPQSPVTNTTVTSGSILNSVIGIFLPTFSYAVPTTVGIVKSDEIVINDDIKCINQTFIGSLECKDNSKIKTSYMHLIKSNQNLKPYRESFDIYVDYLIEIFKAFSLIDFTKINKKFLDEFLIYYNKQANTLVGGTKSIKNGKSYTYLINQTCNHVMITGKNKGKYCNQIITDDTKKIYNKCSKHHI